jgi:tetratricopeptide (TPR) repeat protein
MKIKSRTFQILLIAAAVTGAVILTPIAARAQEDVPPPPTPNTTRTSGRGSIVGRVVLPSGEAVSSRVRVTLSSIRDPENSSIYTDMNGGFGFGNLAEGTYTLEVIGDAKLYEPVVQEVRLIRAMQMRLIINLKEKASAPDKGSAYVVSVGEVDPNVPQAAKKEYEKGTKLVGEGKLQEAIARFKQAIDHYPKYLMARNDLGVQYLKLKKFDEATEQLEAALEINNKALYPHLNLAIVLVEQKLYTQAIDHLNQAMAINSSSPAVHLYLGIASAETDNLETAERELGVALSMGGAEFSVAHFHLAGVYMKRGERDGAIRELKAYLEKSPGGEHVIKARALLKELEGS